MTNITETTEPQTKTFLGIPIQGDIYTGGHNVVAQRPMEDLAPLVQAVLDDPTIVKFGWKQYTPYFNDGDPCVFSVHSLWVLTTSDPSFDPDADDFDDGFDSYTYSVEYSHPSLGKREYKWDREQGKRVPLGYEGPDEARFDRCAALDAALQSGAFNDVLLTTFGDHADITVTREGITVEEVSHD